MCVSTVREPAVVRKRVKDTCEAGAVPIEEKAHSKVKLGFLSSRQTDGGLNVVYKIKPGGWWLFLRYAVPPISESSQRKITSTPSTR